MNLFDQTTLAKIEHLAIIANKVRVGMMKGDRRSRKRGSSIDFADYRDYVPGDDLRRLDWNIFARLERPFIKLLEEKSDLSSSQNFPKLKKKSIALKNGSIKLTGISSIIPSIKLKP